MVMSWVAAGLSTLVTVNRAVPAFLGTIPLPYVAWNSATSGSWDTHTTSLTVALWGSMLISYRRSGFVSWEVMPTYWLPRPFHPSM